MRDKVIWVVDDDVIYQTIINKIIEKSGVFSSHFSFPNGSEALTSLKKIVEDDDDTALPDIILLDINMPVMDGWEFMDEIKKIKSDIRKDIHIYIVSSSIAVEDKNKSATFSNIIGYMPKPISVTELITIASNT
jgi:CheY-like chemotaxis protein